MKLTYSHKYIKNISTCGMIHTENLLNAGKRPQDSDRARKSSQNRVEQKKIEKREKMRKEQDGTCTPMRELERRKALASWEVPPTVRTAGTDQQL